MKTWQKVGIGVGAAVLIGGIVWFSVNQANKGVVPVQTGKAVVQDLTSQVTASGEIKPRDYTNVLGEGFGKITELVVKEGDHVKKGDVLLRLENVQPSADVNAQSAALSGTEAGVQAAEANLKSAQSDLQQRQADYERVKTEWERGQNLFKEGLIPKSDYDTRKNAFDGATAAVQSATSRVQQLKAELDRSHFQHAQNSAMLTRSRDILRKTTYTAPIDGVVSFIAVRVGENVVPGIQNAAGSFLMTISDMAVVTAEVKVDETDIVNVRPGQPADVTIDAIPGKAFKGHVTEVGTQAVLRSSGLATTQTTAGAQEAKDFKVVVQVDDPPSGLRPGLSSTAKIKTSEKKNVLTIPIQALAVRTRKDLEDVEKDSKGKPNSGVTLAAPPATPGTDPKKQEIQGVFAIRNKKAVFVPVETGISGVTDIEVTKGLQPNEEIIIGSYKALRTLRPHTTVKIDNSAPKKAEEEKS
jgi:HlyD family secretion protein